MTTMMSSDHVLTRASEDYLEAIYLLAKKGGDDSVRSVDVAEFLGVSKASVNKGVTQLKETAMVEQNRYGRIVLTAEGKAYAELVWRSHRALRTFLMSDLGVSEEIADKEACLMEHVLSEDTMLRLIGYLEKQGFTISD